jgi:hypothetical protein
MQKDKGILKKQVRDARRAADDLPLREMQFRGVPVGQFSQEQLIRIMGWLMTMYEQERNQFQAATKNAVRPNSDEPVGWGM